MGGTSPHPRNGHRPGRPAARRWRGALRQPPSECAKQHLLVAGAQRVGQDHPAGVDRTRGAPAEAHGCIDASRVVLVPQVLRQRLIPENTWYLGIRRPGRICSPQRRGTRPLGELSASNAGHSWRSRRGPTLRSVIDEATSLDLNGRSLRGDARSRREPWYLNARRVADHPLVGPESVNSGRGESGPHQTRGSRSIRQDFQRGEPQPGLAETNGEPSTHQPGSTCLPAL